MQICKDCGSIYKNNSFKFCPLDGSKLSTTTGKDLLDLSDMPYKDTLGLWEVSVCSTECATTKERRGTLGIYEGYVDDIALLLINNSRREVINKLKFKAVIPKKVEHQNHTGEKVVVDIPAVCRVNGRELSLDVEDSQRLYDELFKNRDVTVSVEMNKITLTLDKGGSK